MAFTISPFGEGSFEEEKILLGGQWNDYFFEHAPFNDQSLNSRTYLIVGRRGCGKSSLGEHFKYHEKPKKSGFITVDQSDDYMLQLRSTAEKLSGSSENVINSLINVWQFIIWQLIFRELRETDPDIKHVSSVVDYSDRSVSRFITALLGGMVAKFLADNGDQLVEMIKESITNIRFDRAKEAVLRCTRKNPLIITIDSREQYSLEDWAEMNIAAALIQCASDFNTRYRHQGIHLKVFFPSEIFPHLKEKYVLNTAKHVRDPLFLHWRPKDLIRLACWRYFRYLRHHNLVKLKESEVDWDDFNDVRNKMWVPYFGEHIKNRNDIQEETLPYVLRHTQLRPRQMIMLCNKIADLAMAERTFPRFSSNAIRAAVRHIELELADEVINSYGRIYQNVGDIILALSGLGMVFKGSELDRVAPRTASLWARGTYSPVLFRQIVAELGIVGRARGSRDNKIGIVEGDFEFAMRDRLFVTEYDECVIHPMFYAKLNTQRINGTVVYPFPDHPDFIILRNGKD